MHLLPASASVSISMFSPQLLLSLFIFFKLVCLGLFSTSGRKALSHGWQHSAPLYG